MRYSNSTWTQRARLLNHNVRHQYFMGADISVGGAWLYVPHIQNTKASFWSCQFVVSSTTLLGHVPYSREKINVSTKRSSADQKPAQPHRSHAMHSSVFALWTTALRGGVLLSPRALTPLLSPPTCDVYAADSFHPWRSVKVILGNHGAGGVGGAEGGWQAQAKVKLQHLIIRELPEWRSSETDESKKLEEPFDFLILMIGTDHSKITWTELITNTK